MPLHVSSTFSHRQEVKRVLYSLWYHHTYRWPSRAQVERGLLISRKTSLANFSYNLTTQNIVSHPWTVSLTILPRRILSVTLGLFLLQSYHAECCQSPLDCFCYNFTTQNIVSHPWTVYGLVTRIPACQQDFY